MLAYLLSVLAGFSFTALSAAPRSQFPPPLEKDVEDRLFRQWREKGDMTAREKLIEHNLRLVAHIVRKYYAASPDKDDLVSIGSIGLIKSIDSFDPDNGARFATYSARCIQNEILMYFRSQKKIRAGGFHPRYHRHRQGRKSADLHGCDGLGRHHSG